MRIPIKSPVRTLCPWDPRPGCPASVYLKKPMSEEERAVALRGPRSEDLDPRPGCPASVYLKKPMSDEALAASLSQAPDWKAARRRATVEPIVDGPSYLPGDKSFDEPEGDPS